MLFWHKKCRQTSAGATSKLPRFQADMHLRRGKNVLTAKSPLQATLGNWWLMILSIIIIIMQAFASALLALLHNDERGEVEKAMAEIKGSGSSDTCTSMYRTWFGKCLLRLSLFCWICFSRLEGGWEMAFCCCCRLQTPNWSFTLKTWISYDNIPTKNYLDYEVTYLWLLFSKKYCSRNYEMNIKSCFLSVCILISHKWWNSKWKQTRLMVLWLFTALRCSLLVYYYTFSAILLHTLDW